jgi:hypothetical protein
MNKDFWKLYRLMYIFAADVPQYHVFRRTIRGCYVHRARKLVYAGTSLAPTPLVTKLVTLLAPSRWLLLVSEVQSGATLEAEEGSVLATCPLSGPSHCGMLVSYHMKETVELTF